MSDRSPEEPLDPGAERDLVEADGLILPLDLDSIDDDELTDDELIEAWDEEDRHAIEVLAEALPEFRNRPEPATLRSAAAVLRHGLRSKDPVLRPVARANGWSRRVPEDDRHLWIETVGALIKMKDDPGLPAEEQSLLMTLEHGDLLGAVVGAVRAGAGSDAEPTDLVSHIDSCPEVDGEVDDDDRGLIEAAFSLLVPVWEVAGALDEDHRLTELGVWGLPHAVAWAWGAESD